MSAWDIVRAITIGQAVIILILTACILFRYAKKLVMTPKEDRALPIHIILICGSYLGLVGSQAFEIYLRIGEPPNWRTLSGLICFPMGSAALIFMLVHLSMRRVIVGAVLEQARRETEAELARSLTRRERTLQRIEAAAGAAAERAEIAVHKVEVATEKVEHSHEEGEKHRSKIENELAHVHEAATAAFTEANHLNEKVAAAQKAAEEAQLSQGMCLDKVQHTLETIHEDAATAKEKAAEASRKADIIGEIGEDTNKRVRKIGQDLSEPPNSPS